MPSSYRRKKRTTRRRKKPSRRYRLVSMGTPAGVPTQKVVKMRYCDKQTITCTSGILNTYVFSANSIHDPNTTGVGHQPMGHDTMASLYNHYVVLGSRITIRWAQLGSTTANDMMVGCYLNDDSATSYSTFTSIVEARKGHYKFLVQQRNQQITMCNYSAKRFFNVKDVKDNLDRLGAAVNSNPTESAKFICWAESRDGTTTNTATLIVTIDYIVAFSEPADLLPS